MIVKKTYVFNFSDRILFKGHINLIKYLLQRSINIIIKTLSHITLYLKFLHKKLLKQ